MCEATSAAHARAETADAFASMCGRGMDVCLCEDRVEDPVERKRAWAQENVCVCAGTSGRLAVPRGWGAGVEYQPSAGGARMGGMGTEDHEV